MRLRRNGDADRQQGKLPGTWDKPHNDLLRFMLQRQLPSVYAAQEVRPGDRLLREHQEQVLLDDLIRRERDKPKVMERILTRLHNMVGRDKAAARAAREWEIECEEQEVIAAANLSGVAPAGDSE